MAKKKVKHILESKTFWVNMLVLGLVAYTTATKQDTNEFVSNVLDSVMVLTPLVNIALRLISNEPVTIKK